MSQTVSPSTSRCYGLARVSRAWNVSRASVYRFLKETPPNTIARRPGPVGACSDAELAEPYPPANSLPHAFAVKRYPQVWARFGSCSALRSSRQAERVMGANAACSLLVALNAPTASRTMERSSPTRSMKCGEQDMTQTITVAEGRAYVFVAVEHANSEVVGIHAARSANRFEALEPVRQGVHRCFGSASHLVWRTRLMLRHDHGLELHVRSALPGRDRMLGYRSFALLRARAPGQRRRGALHPNLEGEPIVGANLRYDRRAPSRARRVRHALQRNLARRPPR